jgi:alkylation response protein AidB-like acyl-CoA dehydrogenase
MTIPRTLFGEDHQTFRTTARRFVETELVPHHAEWEKAGRVPREAWRKAGETGLLCCSVPERYGGPGADWLCNAIVIEELARAGITGPAFHVHSEMVAPYILHAGSDAIRAHWLPRMVAGEAIGALAITEPGAGSDAKAIRTLARREGDDYVIRGQKTYISNGQLADVVVLACKTDPKAGARGVSLILVETTRPGFARGRALEKIGLKAQDTSELAFEDVRVPVGNRLGEEGEGFTIMMAHLAQERLVQAVRSVVVAESVIDWTVAYTSERTAFGGTIADFQNTQFVLAGLAAQVSAIRVYVDRCIERFLTGELDPIDAAKVKLLATDLHVKVVDECLQFFGGYGYMLEYPIARAYVDARVTRIAGGAAEVMKHLIARDLFSRHARRN